MHEVYITSSGSFLPNIPVPNKDMEDYLGRINGRDSRCKDRILNQNGIKTRYYALNQQQETTHSNAQMAVKAIENALQNSTMRAADVALLCTGTTQGDLPIPGFASMVHAGLDFGCGNASRNIGENEVK
jgi:3-oxoacyl-[acyl-carrier-protein] synthase III